MVDVGMGGKCVKPISLFVYISVSQSERTKDNRKLEQNNFGNVQNERPSDRLFVVDKQLY